MPMRMVVVRHVRVRVPHRLVPMHVAVSGHGRRMIVRVMQVVMAVGMLVLDRFMQMLVRMPLGQVKQDACQHQPGACHQPEAAVAFAEKKGDHRPDEGREGEYRACAGGTERPLRKQVEAKTQPVTGRSDGQEAQR